MTILTYLFITMLIGSGYWAHKHESVAEFIIGVLTFPVGVWIVIGAKLSKL